MQRGIERGSHGRYPLDAALIEKPSELREDLFHARHEGLHVLIRRVASKRTLQILVRCQEVKDYMIGDPRFQCLDVACRPLLVVLKLGLQSLKAVNTRLKLAARRFDSSLGGLRGAVLRFVALPFLAHSLILSELRAPEVISRPSKRLAT